MAMMTTSNPSSMTDMYQTYFNRQLLKPLEYGLVLAKLAYQKDLPMKKGAVTMRFFRRQKADSSTVESLTQGVAPTNFQELPSGYVDVTLAQIGQVVKLSDILQWTQIFDWLEQSTQWMGENAAKKCEEVIRNIIISTMLNSNGNFERFAGLPNTGNSATDFTTLFGAPANNAKFTRPEALKCITQLKQALVPMVNGRYAAAIAPQVMHDVRLDTTWVQTGEYQKADSLFNRDSITLDGARYMETDVAEKENVYGTYADSGIIFTTMFIGSQAYGVPKLTGTSSPQAPQVIINNGPDKTDPLNQYTLAGWKAFYNALMLTTNLTGDPFRVCLFRSKSTFNS